MLGGPTAVGVLGRILGRANDLVAELVRVHLVQRHEVDRRRIRPQQCGLTAAELPGRGEIAGSGWRSESPPTYMPALTGELILGAQR
jgi:hypothetical protein